MPPPATRHPVIIYLCACVYAVGVAEDEAVANPAVRGNLNKGNRRIADYHGQIAWSDRVNFRRRWHSHEKARVGASIPKM